MIISKDIAFNLGADPKVKDVIELAEKLRGTNPEAHVEFQINKGQRDEQIVSGRIRERM
jgi:hypothetical protein